MTKSKRLVVFLIFPLLFLSVVLLVLFIGEVENSHTDRAVFRVNPTGYLTVDTEYGTINIETTDEDRVNIAVKKEWKAKLLALRPRFVKWISELPRDLEVTTKHEEADTQSDIRVEVKFKRGQEYWQEGLKWLTVDIQVKVPHQYNVTLKTASSGDIHIDNLMGTVSAEVLDGNLHLIQVPEDENVDGSR